MSDSPELESEKLSTEEMINQAAKAAYETVSQMPEVGSAPGDMPLRRFCTHVCREMQKELMQYKIGSRIEEFPGGWDVSHHDYLIVQRGDKVYRVDPTWKQFLGANDVDIATVPDVLISEADEEGNFQNPDYLPDSLKRIY